MIRLTSKKTTIIAMAFIGGALVLSCFAAAPTDEEAVRATITNYIEGYYTWDTSRMENSLHPHYLKHTISGSSGDLRMTEWTGLQMVQAVRSHAASDLPLSERKEQITVLDIADDVAFLPSTPGLKGWDAKSLCYSFTGQPPWFCVGNYGGIGVVDLAPPGDLPQAGGRHRSGCHAARTSRRSSQ